MPIKNDAVGETELRDYLLGRISGDACERLDELSVCNDIFSQRLRAAEDDLVDAYVRGELSGEESRRFDLHYMATGMRRKKVEVARALYLTARSASAPAGLSMVVTNREAADTRRTGLLRSIWMWQNSDLRWAFACAALIIFVACTTWLAISNYRLRRQNHDAREAYGALEKEYRQLEQQAASRLQPENETPPTGSYSGVPVTQISSLDIPPPLRSPGRIPAVSLAAADQWLQLKLGLEANDFPEYRVDLKDLGKEKYVWHSRVVAGSKIDHGVAVVVMVPAEAVKNRGDYGAQVLGIAANGKSELLGEYVFQIAEQGSHSTGKR